MSHKNKATQRRSRAFGAWLRREREETAILFRSIPAAVVSLFVASVICMNLLANKTLVQTDWIALDGGILISWLSFMCMDIITKYFGPRASNKTAVLAAAINLLTSLIFYIVSIIPSNAGDYTALNRILGGTWFILLGSTIGGHQQFPELVHRQRVPGKSRWEAGVCGPDIYLYLYRPVYGQLYFFHHCLCHFCPHILGRLSLDYSAMRNVLLNWSCRGADDGGHFLTLRLQNRQQMENIQRRAGISCL